MENNGNNVTWRIMETWRTMVIVPHVGQLRYGDNGNFTWRAMKIWEQW